MCKKKKSVMKMSKMLMDRNVLIMIIVETVEAVNVIINHQDAGMNTPKAVINKKQFVIQ